MKHDQEKPHPPFRSAIEHKCHNCCAEYADGHKDCEVPTCALYFFMPYRKLEPDLSWQSWTARGTGRRPPALRPKYFPGRRVGVATSANIAEGETEVPSDDPT